MAELATGAVSSLLGVIRNETQLLAGVRDDVQFIKEEMESMNSFLLHLARTAPPRGEHDEQVRTWMGQVRLLAQDCNNCIDLYLYRGNPDIHRGRGGLLRRYVWWLPWFVNKMFAQHQAALQLRVLKERARDVGQRRLRYGVEVPAAPTMAALGGPPRRGALSSSAKGVVVAPAVTAGVDAGDEENEGEDEDDEEDQVVAAAARHHPGIREALFGLGAFTLEDYFNGKLAEWIDQVRRQAADHHAGGSSKMLLPSIAIVAPWEDPGDALSLADQALAAARTRFHGSVLVDIPAVHLSYIRLDAEDILCYIWRELERRTRSQQAQQQQDTSHYWLADTDKWGIYHERRAAISQLRENIKQRVYAKLEKIENEVQQAKAEQMHLHPGKEGVKAYLSNKPLGVLLLMLQSATAAQVRKEDEPTLAALYQDILDTTVDKLHECLQEQEEATTGAKQLHPICLSHAQYRRILRHVFPKTSFEPGNANQVRLPTSSTTTTLSEDQIKGLINKAKQEILHELQGDKSEKKETSGPDELPEVAATRNKIDEIKLKIRGLMSIQGIINMIQNYLKGARILIILKIDDNYVLGWEETRYALSLLDCVAGVVIIAASKNNQQAAKEFCYPLQEPMEYSPVGLYHDIVLRLTRKKVNEQDNKHSSQIFHGILDQCNPHEFCMKMFAHALYTNPKRSKEELRKLHSTLQAVYPRSLGRIASKMIKFSYSDLPKEYKSCLLYLAIFPPGHKIKRSTLIGRWVVEGLITTEDWRWSSSVHNARKCFDALIKKWLVCPADISATGEVKSCMVDDQVHEFITKIAMKQRIVETRLSLHLARHFSISNDLRLRASENINIFLQKLSESSQFCLLKVLDLEGCQCFGMKYKRYLKDICCKIKLLKYLSLRRTNVIQLPIEINNLHELEVLDIRQTEVPPFATRNVHLLKLKRLLAGHTDPSPSSIYPSTTIIVKEFPRSVDIPEKVENMEAMEVLSCVKAQTSQDLKDIGKLWQLRKLGVVIKDKDTHLSSFLKTIDDLHDCLQSLSITLLNAGLKGVPSSGGLADAIRPPKVESLSISGITHKVNLLRLLADGNNQLTKVTLSSIMLNQNDLDQVLSKLPMLLSMRLRHVAYTKSKLTFKKGVFQKLNSFLVEGSNITDISFDNGATPELEKITLSFIDDVKSLSGVEDLPRLKEIELNTNTTTGTTSRNNEDKNSSSGRSSATTTTTTTTTTNSNNEDIDNSTSSTTTTITTSNNTNRLLSLLDNAKKIAKVTLHGTLLRQGDLQILARKPNMHCLALLEKSYVDSKITFNKNEFQKLSFLIVNCSDITNISFTEGSAPKLEKIIWTFSKGKTDYSLSGINNLPKLKNFEFYGDVVPDKVQEALDNHRNKPVIKKNEPENQEKAIENSPARKEDECFQFCWKNQV